MKPEVTMISPDHALALVMEQVHPLREAETVPLEQAAGWVLAQPVVADRDIPPFDRVCMDGYAGHHAEIALDRPCEVQLELRAGYGSPEEVHPGKLARIMTGAPLPPGTDVVIPQEVTRPEEGGVRVMELPEPYRHVARQGSDSRAGQLLLSPGTMLTPIGVAVLASVGQCEVQIVRRPRIAIVTTGDEIVDCHQTPGPSQIRNSNYYSLAAQARMAGFDRLFRYHAIDQRDNLSEVLRQALQADVVIITGGVSMGQYDLVPEVLATLGVQRHFHKVAQQPGKPLWFGSAQRCLVFGAPGNPLATVLTFDRYVLPALRCLAGLPTRRAQFSGRLTLPVKGRSDGRDLFLFAQAESSTPGSYTLQPLLRRGSADVFSTAEANAICRLPPEKSLPKDAEIAFTMLGVFEGAF
ncbi:MAG: molybdopterin molybdotransferase MoeA [Bradymonadales bacterium]|nr:molybdopterin molybdotransferase MoeA [Bradymonadales bacterium]